MPKLTVPDGDPLNELNPCHTPPGSPAGGQFCSEPGGGRSASELERERLRHKNEDTQLRIQRMRRERLENMTVGDVERHEQMAKGGGPTVYDRKTKRMQGQRLRKKGY